MKTKYGTFVIFAALFALAVSLFWVPMDVGAVVLNIPSAGAALATVGLLGFGLETTGTSSDALIRELKTTIEGQGRAWEEFKAEHRRELEAVKKGAAPDPLLTEKLTKLSAAMDTYQTQIDAIEKKLNRPDAGLPAILADEQKSLAAFNMELKAAAILGGQPLPGELSIDQYRDYKRAFNSFMRKGDKTTLDAERKAMSVGVDTDGGYLVPADTQGRIIQRLWEMSDMRQISDVQVISSDRLEGIEDIDEAGAGWVGEMGSRDDTDTPTVNKYEIPAHEMYAQPKATQKLLDDAAVDIEAWLAAKVASKLTRVEGAGYVNGDGIAKPRGFTTYTTAATADATRAWGQMEHVNTGVNGDFHATLPADTLFDVESAFKPGYLAGARWATRRSVTLKIRKLKNATTGDYLWQPGLQAGKPSMLIGYPVHLMEDMPALATGSLSMALGNFKEGYQIVDRLGVRVLRDPYTAKPYVKFYTTKRTGGAVVNFEAIKFVRFAA